MVEITDEESLKAWFETPEGQPHQVRVWIAARAALRGLPGIAREKDIATRDRLAFVSFRAMLISAGAGTCPPAEMKTYSSAAAAARSAAFSAAAAALSAAAAFSAARSAAFSAAAAAALSAALSAAAAYSAAAADSAAPRDGWPPLWQGDTAPVQALLDQWDSLKARYTSPESREVWGFWAWWYQSLLDGHPPQKLWDLTHRIALEVTEEEWDAGPEKVAARIREIEAEWTAQSLPYAEELKKSEQTGLYDVVATARSPKHAVDHILKQVRFALETATRGNSGLNTYCVAYRYILYACEEVAEDANTVEMQFSLAAKSLKRGLEKGTYVEDQGIEELIDSLTTHTMQLRADHPDVRAAWTTRLAQGLREARPEQMAETAKAITAYAETTEGRLKTETLMDRDVVASDESADVQAEAVQRTIGRAAKQSQLEKASDAVKAIDKSGGVTSLKIGYLAYKLVEILIRYW